MDNHNYNTDPTIEDCWQLIHDGVKSRKSNYHTMTLGYLANNQPRCINVIPRKLCTDGAIIHFHTDIRSEKTQHLRQHPTVSCLFWCRLTKIQLSLTAEATVRHNDPLTLDAWQNMRQMSKICYCADISPNTATAQRSTGFTPDAWSQRHQIAETMKPYEHFSIIQLHVKRIERLHLSASGHDRASFTRTKDKQWERQWHAP